jgi:hypothetical protein
MITTTPPYIWANVAPKAYSGATFSVVKHSPSTNARYENVFVRAATEAVSRGTRASVDARLAWLEDAYREVANKRFDAATDMLLEHLDDLLGDGDIAGANSVLQALDVERLDIQSMLTVLAVTRPAKEQLANRARFLGHVEEQLADEGSVRAERLLAGLR